MAAQPGLFDDDGAPPRARTMDSRAAMVEQVARDMRVLLEDEVYHAPSTEFFAERVVAFRKAIAEIDAANQIGEPT